MKKKSKKLPKIMGMENSVVKQDHSNSPAGEFKTKGSSINRILYKKKSNRKLIPIIIILIFIVLILTVILLLFQLNLIKNPFADINAEPKLFIIKDECSLIVGQLIHNIKDEDSCQQICKSNCAVRSFNFHNSEFKEIENNCNECNCYCL